MSSYRCDVYTRKCMVERVAAGLGVARGVAWQGACAGARNSVLLCFLQRVVGNVVVGAAGACCGPCLFAVAAGADAAWHIMGQVMALDCGRRMRFQCIGLSAGGRFLAVGCEDLCVRIWDLQAMEVVAVCRGHSGEISSLAWAPDEKQLVSVGTDAAVCVWNFYLGGGVPPSSGR